MRQRPLESQGFRQALRGTESDVFEGDSYRARRSYPGAHDRGCGAEEPGEGKSFTPGSEAAAGGAIPPLTVTIRRWLCAQYNSSEVSSARGALDKSGLRAEIIVRVFWPPDWILFRSESAHTVIVARVNLELNVVPVVP